VKDKPFLTNKKDKVISLTDWHVPFEDKRIVELELQFCKEEQPKIIILHELHDFYDLSKFDKNPDRQGKLQEELDRVNLYLDDLREYCPKARIILLNSNHLDRLKRYLWRVAKELHGLRSLSLEKLLELKDRKIEYMEEFIYNGVIFKHGDIVRKFSSYTAKGEFEREGMSGCSGHSHRLGVYFHRVRGGEYVWIESGCGCDLDAEYIDGIANWQHGFSVFGFDKGGKHFYPTVVPIIDYRIDWGDKTYYG
jgi:hypothetical protein